MTKKVKHSNRKFSQVLIQKGLIYKRTDGALAGFQDFMAATLTRNADVKSLSPEVMVYNLFILFFFGQHTNLPNQIQR